MDFVIHIIIRRMKGEVTFNFKVTWFPSPLALLTPLIHEGETGARTTFSYTWGAQRVVQLEAGAGAE